jgi:hypothetical protein
MAAVLYGQVVTNTFLSSVSDHGGTPLADVSGLAWHIFGVTTAVSYDLSYSTTVRHNGSFVADDWHPGSGVGPAFLLHKSKASGSTSAVHTQHDATGSHGSYIQDSLGHWDQDTGSSSTSRATD